MPVFSCHVCHWVEPRLLVGYLLDVFVYVSFRDRIERRQTNTIICFVAERWKRRTLCCTTDILHFVHEK